MKSEKYLRKQGERGFLGRGRPTAKAEGLEVHVACQVRKGDY